MTDLTSGASTLRTRRCGRIVTAGGRLQAVYGRWWPHLGNLLQVLWDMHAPTGRRDCCELFYHQPLNSRGFLSISYVHAGPETSLSTLYVAGLVLDEIARLRGSLAIVSNITNDRISDRSLMRWGWSAHCANLPGRHFIKRFYGQYPAPPASWRARMGLDALHPENTAE
ncbi:MAG: hypothetical protein R3C53_10240 [Pirellulaceae bacterium]